MLNRICGGIILFILLAVVMYAIRSVNTVPTIIIEEGDVDLVVRIPDGNTQEELTIPSEPDVILDELVDQHCIALAIYGEARGETAEGMEWVAWVVKNRANARNLSYCDVLLQPYQFEAFKRGSSLRRLAIETKNGELTFPRMNNTWLQNKIHQIARKVYESQVDPTNGATHFWSPVAQEFLGRKPPYWSSELTFIRKAGNHRFYREG